MNKLVILTGIIVVVLLAFITAFAYSQSVNQFQANQKENTSPIPTANPTVSSSPNPTLAPTLIPTPTPSPLPDASPPSDPAAYAAFDGPLGSFWISSPANTTCNTNSITLIIGGQTITGANVHLSMYYSVDGQEAKALNVEASNTSTFTESFTGSLVLPPLNSGEHRVTVFGNLEANGSHLAQVTVDFTIQ